jgi:hypothetical protein
MTYTVFEYMYRDAANYKAHGELWLNGSISDSEKSMIIEKLEAQEFFIAEQLGIPALYQELFNLSGGRTEEDHAWHMISGFRQEIAENKPEAEAIWGTSKELLDRFVSTTQWKPELSPNFQW